MAIDIVALGAAIVALLGLIAQIVRNRRVDALELLKKINDLVVEMAEIKTKTSIWWAILEQHAATILHHPVTPERDRLIESYLAGSITEDDLSRFISDLDSIVKDRKHSSGERLAASLLLAAIYQRYHIAPIAK